MSNFFISKNFAKPGDVLTIDGTCLTGGSTFYSTDENIAQVHPGTRSVSVYGLGEVKIMESTADCTNTGGVLLTSTEDGLPFFMSRSDYDTFTIWEIVFVFVVICVAWFIKFLK